MLQRSAFSQEINTSTRPRHSDKALLTGPQGSSSPLIPTGLAPTTLMATAIRLQLGGTETAELMTWISNQWSVASQSPHGVRVDHASRELAQSTWKPRFKHQIILRIYIYIYSDVYIYFHTYMCLFNMYIYIFILIY